MNGESISMTDDTQSNMVDLQIRITHQEAAIEELTAHFLVLEKQMLVMETQLQEIKSLLKEAVPSLVASQAEETPPPHY